MFSYTIEGMEKIYLYYGKKKVLARKEICKGCSKELLIGKTVKHSGFCRKCFGAKLGKRERVSILGGRSQKKGYQRICPECGDIKHTERKPREGTLCKSCHCKIKLSWKAVGRKHPREGTKLDEDHYRKIKRDWSKRNKHSRKKKLVQKFGNECNRCKQKNLPMCVYEFHHLDGTKKKDRISNMLGRTDYTNVLEEAEKCIMVCSNCHKIIHYGESTIQEIP